MMGNDRLTWAEIRRRDPGGASARDRERWNHRPPGLGGESDRPTPHLEQTRHDDIGPLVATRGFDEDAVRMPVGSDDADGELRPADVER